jgi:hypothetical protein
MLKLQIPEEMLEELHSTACGFGFTSSEEFVCFVLKELLEAIKNKDLLAGSEKISEQEQKELRAKLQNLGYM